MTMKASLIRFSVVKEDEGGSEAVDARVALSFPESKDNIAGFVDIYFEHPGASQLTFNDAEKLITDKVCSYILS